MRQNQLRKSKGNRTQVHTHSYGYPAPLLYGQNAEPRRLRSSKSRRFGKGWLRLGALTALGLVLLLWLLRRTLERSLAWGLAFATVITLVLVPSVFALQQGWRLRRQKVRVPS